jgi:hypothetical protein
LAEKEKVWKGQTFSINARIIKKILHLSETMLACGLFLIIVFYISLPGQGCEPLIFLHLFYLTLPLSSHSSSPYIIFIPTRILTFTGRAGMPEVMEPLLKIFYSCN